MKKVAVITDSNSGITQSEAKKLGIHVVPMPFFVNGDTFYEDISMSQDEFYGYLAQGADVMTSQPAPDTLMKLWDSVLECYDEIVYIPMSSGLSSSCGTAMMLSYEEKYENKVFVGSRGWALQDTENSKKMINRECQRLELSIKDAINNYDNTKEIIAFMHYPPLVKQQLLENNHLEFYKVLKKYDIKRCYYGHLHGNSHKDAINGDIGGINFSLISADYLNFKLLKIN